MSKALRIAVVLCVSSIAVVPTPARAQTPEGAFGPPVTVCGVQVPAPTAQPPVSTLPVVYLIAPCFEAQGNSTLVDQETYLYYIHLQPSRPSQALWVPWDGTATQTALEDFRRLWATGFLDDLKIEATDYTFANGAIGKIVTYHIEERQRLKIIDYEGSKTLQVTAIDERLRAANTQMRPDTFLDDATVRKIEGLLRDMLKEKGFTYAEVTHRVTPMPGGPKLARLTFTLSEGPEVKVRRITFDGNQAISDRRLRKQMKNNKEKGLLPFITARGTYKEDKYEEDVERILEYYRNRGYVRVTLGDPEVIVLEEHTDKRTRWIELRIPVTEGKRYKVGDFQFDGNTVLRSEVLRQLFPVKAGDYYNNKTIAEGYKKMKDAYGAGGYWELNGYPEFAFSDDDQGLNGFAGSAVPPGAARPPFAGSPTVAVTLRINEGPRYFVNRITFAGNTLTHDAVLRRELQLVESAVFNTEALKNSVLRLNQLGYFKPIDENLDIALEKAPNSENKIDVNVRLTEQNRNQMNFGAGASQYEGLFGNLSFTTMNFMGRGENLTVSAQIGQRATNYQLGFTEPFLFGRPITAGANLYSSKVDYYGSANEVDYSEVREGFTLSGGRLVKRFSRAYLNYTYEVIDVAVRDGLLSTESESTDAGVPLFNQFLDPGRHFESRISPTFVYNTVDNPFMPRRGTRFTGSYHVAGGLLGGSTSYIKPEAEMIAYFPHTRRTALGVRANAGWLKSYGVTEELPYYLRYFLGGEYQIRGVDVRTVGPVDSQNRALGGNKFLLFNAEYYFDVASAVRLLAFHDAGQAFGEGQPVVLAQLRTSTGAELRFMMPVLNVPFRLIYAWNLYRDTFQKSRTFKFAVGTTF